MRSVMILPLWLLLMVCELVPRKFFVRILKMKEEHTWSLQVMNELLQHASDEDMSRMITRTTSEQLPIFLQREEVNGHWWAESEAMVTPPSSTITIETPLMIAVKNGVVEMVEKTLELFPSTIKDVNTEGKNILLQAVEYRQPKVCQFLCKQQWLTECLFRQVDKDENNVLHLAASLRLDLFNHGEALSMTRELNWFEFVKNRVPHGLLERHNRKMETPGDIFRESHKELMERERKWVTTTSQACFMVSTLVLSVVYATCTNVPGGYDDKSGNAILRNNPVFQDFQSYSSLAFFFSLVSTLSFLIIVASPSRSVHSWRYFHLQLYFGMSSMFLSIVFLWISFLRGSFFMFGDYDQNYAPLHFILRSSIIIPLASIQLLFSQRAPSPSPRRKATYPIEFR